MSRLFLIFLTTLLLFTMPKTLSAQPIQHPIAKKIPKVDIIHGDRRVDEYAWLRGKTNRAVVAYLNAEDAYAEAAMKPTRPMQ